MLYPQGITSTSYEIQSGTKKIGRNAFWVNNKLESLKIPASVTVIPSDTFDSMLTLQEFIVDEKNTVFKSIDGVFFRKRSKYSKHYSILFQFPSAKKDRVYEAPDDVTILNRYSFSNSRIERNISLGHNLKEIGSNIFLDSAGCYLTYHGLKEPKYSMDFLNIDHGPIYVQVCNEYEGETFLGVKVNKSDLIYCKEPDLEEDNNEFPVIDDRDNIVEITKDFQCVPYTEAIEDNGIKNEEEKKK